MHRRAFCRLAAAALALPAVPRLAAAAAPLVERRITAAPGIAPLFGAPRRPVVIWGYDGKAPGPEIRCRQGERLRVVVANRLAEETTVHWHGVRLPHAMDGVPGVTQPAIPPGGTFTYEFDLPDAGTFWYHPHANSAEQLERGLAGALIVEERQPIAADRDITWVIDDWLLGEGNVLHGDFGNLHSMAHAGRLGNVITVNGQAQPVLQVRAGERIRLRLINAANARIFQLRFAGHAPRVIATDGHACPPHERPEGLLLGPGMRLDVVLDMAGSPDSRFVVSDGYNRGQEGDVATIAYGPEPLRASLRDDPVALPANPLAEPDLGAAERLEVVLDGGAMGRATHGVVDGRRMTLQEMVRGHGLAWTMNGVAAKGHIHEPLLTCRLGRSYRIVFDNRSAWPHPMHLHGHVFRVLSRNGAPEPHTPWADTVLLGPRERVEVALVADNPGDWMLHCHILEHQQGGMMALMRVTP